MGAAAARRWRWRRCRPRDVVLALLLASVLAPLALYCGAPISPFSGPLLTGRRASVRDPSNSVARSEMGKRLNTLKQDTFGAVVKEPVQTVASAIGARGKDGVVIEVDHGTQFGKGGVIRKNVDRGRVSVRSSESTVSKDNILWNGKEMEMESEDPVQNEREHDGNAAITGKQGGGQLGKESGRGSDVEASNQKAAAMRGNPSASLKTVKES